MRPKLLPLSEQVIVITGATSGIGLTTARMAARRGASVVAVARSEEALKQLVAELQSAGARALSVVADVGREEDVNRAAQAAIDSFGRIDTWVNNAGVSVYGSLREVSDADHRRLFETNFWGTVYGSRVAVQRIGVRGGALVNVGSVLSDRAIPVQGMYCASKHAVKGFTDALRMEVEHEGLPVSVTLIKPSAIDTPYTRHAKNYMDVFPKNPPPVYAPQAVARAILHAAEHPVRDLTVGGGGRLLATLGNVLPRTLDRVMEMTMFRQQRSAKPKDYRRNEALYRGGEDLAERGDYDGPVFRHSAYTRAAMNPWLTGAAVVAGIGIAAAALAKGREPVSTPRRAIRGAGRLVRQMV